MLYQPIENSFDVPRDIRVGMLVDGHASCGVRHVDVANPAGYAGIANHLFDLAGDIDELRALAGLYAKRVHDQREFMGPE
jgi:hypothetical protein